MDGVLQVSAVYRFGRTVGEMASVPQALSQGVVGHRGDYSVEVTAPDTSRNAGYRRQGPDDESPIMWCLEFQVVCSRNDTNESQAEVAVDVNEAVARDIWLALTLNAPNLGFPGSLPQRESLSVTLDGSPIRISRHDPNSVMVIHESVVSIDQFRRATAGEFRPSRARTMVAEAQYQALYNPNASPVTAVVVAASACEVATHGRVRELSANDFARLTKELIPEGSQAKISTKAIIDTVIPVLTGRRLSDEDSELWGRVKGLLVARDEAVHQGVLSPDLNVASLTYQAAKYIEWVEGLAPRGTTG